MNFPTYEEGHVSGLVAIVSVLETKDSGFESFISTLCVRNLYLAVLFYMT
jgi:hypothetical protein